MKLSFNLKVAYGHERYYPIDDAAKALVEQLCGRRCFTRPDVLLLAGAGAEIRVENNGTHVSTITQDGVFSARAKIE